MARVGVLISGCGYLDGAEIHESVVTLLALSRAGHEIVPLAPAIEQRQTVDHRSGDKVSDGGRKVDEEAARIFRGKPLPPSQAGELDALVLPGGFGAALNLCDFALVGPKATVEPQTRELIRKMVAAGKPVAAWCIAPALVAAALGGKPRAKLTIGNDKGTAQAIEATGAVHVDCPVTECVVDEKNRIVTAPAYMYDAPIADVAAGIEKGVAALGRWLG